MSTTDPQTIDPHGLLASGAELATVSELARMLGASGTSLKALLHGPVGATVRHARRKPGPVLWHVAEARAAIAPHLPALEERRRRAEELEREQRAARVRRLASKKEAPVKAKGKPAPSPKPATRAPSTRPTSTPSRGTAGPEVIVMRKSVRP